MKILKYIPFFGLVVACAVANTVSAATECYPESVFLRLPSVSKEMPATEKEIVAAYGGLPVVFRGAASNWEASKFTLDYLASAHGDERVGVSMRLWGFDRNSPQSPVVSIEEMVRLVREQKGEFYPMIDKGETHQCKHFTEGPCEEMIYEQYDEKHFPSIKGECFLSDYLRPDETTAYPEIDVEQWKKNDEISLSFWFMVWLPGHETHIHAHGSTFLMQIEGSKRVFLSREFCTNIGLEAEKGFEDCLFSSLSVYEVVIHPGDVLYIPNSWVHHVITLSEPSVSMAYGIFEDPEPSVACGILDDLELESRE